MKQFIRSVSLLVTAALLLMLLPAFCVTVSAEEEEFVVGDFSFHKFSEAEKYGEGDRTLISAHRYLGNDTQVTIPAVVDGLAVTEIDGSFFENKLDVTAVTVSEGITRINTGAFKGCSALETIHLPDSLTYLEYWTFRDTAWYQAQPYNTVLYIDNILCEYKSVMANRLISWSSRELLRLPMPALTQKCKALFFRTA